MRTKEKKYPVKVGDKIEYWSKSKIDWLWGGTKEKPFDWINATINRSI